MQSDEVPICHSRRVSRKDSALYAFRSPSPSIESLVLNKCCYSHHPGEEIQQLWHEYEKGTSPAARLVKDFDKVRA